MSPTLRPLRVLALVAAAAFVVAACGPSREEADRIVAREEAQHQPPPPSSIQLLCTVLAPALPYLEAEHRTVAGLVADRTAEVAGDASLIAFARFGTEGNFGRYDRALLYLVRLYGEEDVPVPRQPPPSAEVIASAKAIDREIARGRCR